MNSAEGIDMFRVPCWYLVHGTWYSSIILSVVLVVLAPYVRNFCININSCTGMIVRVILRVCSAL